MLGQVGEGLENQLLEQDGGQVAEDTLLSLDVAEHIAKQKEHRLKIIASTEKLSQFMLIWSIKGTGYFLARYLLFVGGSSYLWLALSLCFSIAMSPSVAAMGGLSVNYKEGVEVNGGEKIFVFGAGILSSGATTWLASKQFTDVQRSTEIAITEIKEDIRELQKPSPFNDPWLAGGLMFAAVLFGIKSLTSLGGSK